MPETVRRVVSLLVIVLFGTHSAAQPAQPAQDPLENCIDRGLAFLALMQEKDGSWIGSNIKHPSITSLAILAFLSAGHVPGEGPYQSNVDKGIRWIVQQQQANGMFIDQGGSEMYNQGICTLMLAEAAAMTDARLSREIKPKLEKAVQRILQAQRGSQGTFSGGWRYRVDSHDADMSISGWQIMALRAARNCGCDVPSERMERAMQFVLQCRDPASNGFAYMPGGPATVACTGTGILALELCGKNRHHSRETLQAGSYLIKTPFKFEDPYFFYTIYYTSQAMFQLGNNYWNIHRPRMHKLLLDRQQRNGSWINNESVGPSYATAMAILALTVEYRFLPIYQRDEQAEP